MYYEILHKNGARLLYNLSSYRRIVLDGVKIKFHQTGFLGIDIVEFYTDKAAKNHYEDIQKLLQKNEKIQPHRFEYMKEWK